MKKMLLAATAAAVVGGVAVAGSPVQAQEAEGFQLQIGGFYNALGIVRDNSDLANGDKIRSYDFNQRGRYTIQGSQTLDNGMTIGFHTQYEMQDNMSNNRAYVYADGGFGRVQFGTMYSAPYLMHVSPPTAGWGIDDTGHSQGVANVNGLGFGAGSQYFLATAPYYVNRAMSFTYMTPRFAGIQAGFTFAPDQQNTQGMNNRVATNLSAQNRAGNPSTGFGFMNPRGNSLQNVVGLALNYQQSFDEFSVALSAGAETGTWNQNAENYASREGINDKRAWTYALGGSVGFAGLNAGVAYNLDNMGMSGLKTHQITTGLTYTVDGFTFGPSFGSTWQKGNNRPAGSPRTHIYEFGARYAFAPGVNLVGSLEHAQFKSGINANDGKATAGLFGVQMNF